MSPKLPFVTQVTPAQSQQLRRDLEEQGFEFTQPPHTLFAARKKGVSCTVYTSGKLVVQGKQAPELIEFYLEPQVLQSFTFGQVVEEDTTPRIGVDEAGKGDFFGALCIAGLQAGNEGIQRLRELGVKDSKNLKDEQILQIAQKIRKEFPHSIVRIGVPKYNEMYANFGNLNHLLAWGHATAIGELVEKTGCTEVLIDQFASEHVVESALKRKQLSVQLTQRTKGESDPVVAGASILARAAFVEDIARLSETWGLTLPKGASAQVIAAGRKLLAQKGKDALRAVGKLHFKTLDAIDPSFRE